MASRFEERLATGPVIVADGGMGALVTSAVPRLRCPEEANLRAPDAVVSLHVGFINAGADLIETNSFGANRRKLAHHFLEDDFEKINSTAVKLARQARETVGRDVFIAGSIGPLGEPATSRVRHELFAEQASLLEGRGADLFMVETFYDLEELVDAVEGIRDVSLAADRRAARPSTRGRHARRRGRAGRPPSASPTLDVSAVGANHGAGLLAALAALEEMDSSKPLAALPNIGLASLSGGRVIFPHATPGLLRGVRRARPRARREDHRRLLRHDPGRDRRDSLGRRGGAEAARTARLRGARAGRLPGRGAARDRPRAGAPGARMGRLGPARPAARRQHRRADRARRRPSRIRAASASSTSTTTRLRGPA